MSFSLGTSAGAGTISIVAGGSIVTGVGTTFTAANINAIIVVGTQWGVISSIASTTSITLDRPFATAVTAAAYSISANIPVITQTGTDTSLAGLTGVPGVTISTSAFGTGTVSVAANSSTVTGVGTAFVAGNIGSYIVVGAQFGIITAVASTTSITLDRVFATAISGSAYNLAKEPTLWTITSALLVVSGSLIINRLTNRLRFLNSANFASSAGACLQVTATGTFNNSVVQTINGYSFKSPNYAILFESNPTINTALGNFIGTATGSTSVFEGNIEFNLSASNSPLTFVLEGNTTLQNGSIINASVAGFNVQFTSTLTTSILTVNNYSSYGCGMRVLGNTTNISNYLSVGAFGAINQSSTAAVNNPIYAGLQDGGGSIGFRTNNLSLKYFQLLNFASSRSSLIGLAQGPSTANSQTLLTNSLNVTAQDSFGLVPDMKLWAKDSNNGNRCSANYGAGLGFEIATTGDLTYTATTNASGVVTLPSVISAIFWQVTSGVLALLQVDHRGNGGSTSQNLIFYACSYKHNLAQQKPDMWAFNTATGLYNTPTSKATTYLLLADTAITQTTMATVAAYTTLNTAQQLYDYAKYYLYTNFAGQTATYVTRSGDVINAGSYNVTIDATAATPFVFAGSTITAKSSTFTGSLTTSGAVTLTNGAVFSSNTVTANVSQATPTNFTGVTINGNLTYNTNTPITITLTNCAISGTVSNSGSGLVTISLTNSTIGTVGSNVTSRITTSLNINGLTAGSQVYVENGSGTQVVYVASSSTSYTLDTTGQTGTWSWKVARYGFTAQTGTHSPAVASTTVTVTLVADAFITQPTKATVASYDTLLNMDRLYDYAAYYETLEIGIPYARIITKAGTNASAGSYPVEINDIGDTFLFDGTSLSIYVGLSLAAGTTITGALFTSGVVTIPVTFGNTAITANVLQLSPGDLSGMAITGNLTYNESAPFAFTATITNSTITGTISNSGTAPVKVIKAGTSPFFTAGANVTVVAVVSITTANNLALSTYIIKNGSVDLGWVAQNTARSLEVSATDIFRIYAIAYGYQPVLFTGIATDPTSFRTSLLPETFVDTTLPTVIRDAIADTIAVEFAPGGLLVTYFSEDLSQYSPANVLNGFQYYTVIDGDQIGLGSILANTLDGFAIISGGFEISSPAFYAQVDDSVTSVGPAGFSVPVVVRVTPSVYVAQPSYTPVKKNSSGIVLQTAPWTQQTAAISQSDKTDIRTGLALEATVATKSSQTSVNAIPTNPVLATDTRLNNLDATVSSRLATTGYTAPDNTNIGLIKTKVDTLPTLVQVEASTILAKEATVATKASQSSVDLIPTNPVLVTDTRLDKLDANISSRLATADYTAPPTAIDIASQVETSILTEGDGKAVLQAIADKIGNINVPAASIASAVRTELTTELARIDASVSSRSTLTEIEGSSVIAKETTVATKASQTSVNAIPTNPVITTDSRLDKLDATVSSRLATTGYTAPNNTDIAAIKTKVDTLPILTEIEASTVLAKEATVATKATQASVDTLPTLTEIEASTVLAKEATVATKATQASVDTLPTLTEIEASTVLAKESSVSQVKNNTNLIPGLF